MASVIQNQLGEVRRQRGVTATDLAKRVGVTRQTIYAIEAGTYVPNTEVTLRLAQELDVRVEELFFLEGESAAEAETVQAEMLSAAPLKDGRPVRICRVDQRLVSVPVQAWPYYLPEADGVLTKVGRTKAEVRLFAKDDPHQKKLLIAGCDPAMGMVSSVVERLSGVEIVSAPASSKLAVKWLMEGKVHVAGCHLRDAATGQFNLPYLTREYPGEDLAVVTFASWEQGFVTAPGNPQKIRKVEDIASNPSRFINREVGSGSHELFEQMLRLARITGKKILGYDSFAAGHLAAAYMVVADVADVCIATRSAAQTFGLHFVPVQTERYDLVMHRATLDLPVVQTFLDVLQRASLRRKLETLAGYDTSETGALIT